MGERKIMQYTLIRCRISNKVTHVEKTWAGQHLAANEEPTVLHINF